MDSPQNSCQFSKQKDFETDCASRCAWRKEKKKRYNEFTENDLLWKQIKIEIPLQEQNSLRVQVGKHSIIKLKLSSDTCFFLTGAFWTRRNSGLIEQTL